MNHRNFIQGALTALAGFSILPGAGRVWKATRELIPPAGSIIGAEPYFYVRCTSMPGGYVLVWNRQYLASSGIERWDGHRHTTTEHGGGVR